jgi:hypothetical protein
MKQQSSSIALDTSLQHIDPALASRLAVDVPFLPDCRVDLSTRWPDRLRVGLTAGIEQSLQLTCPGTPADALPIRAVARLEETSRLALPDGPIEKPLQPGKAVSFVWRIQVEPAGIWQGVLWTSLLVPLADGSSAELVLSSLPIQGRAESLLGLSHQALTNLGWVFLGLGLGWLALTKAVRLIRKPGR